MTEQRDVMGRRRPVREHESAARLRAVQAARKAIAANSTLSRDDVAKEFDATPNTVSLAIFILQHGTEEEIAALETGEKGLRPLYDVIHKRVPVEMRAAKQLQPRLSEDRKANIRQEALIWSNLRQALDLIGSMPQASDVVKIVKRNHVRTTVLDRSILEAFSWLSEFSDAWTK